MLSLLKESGLDAAADWAEYHREAGLKTVRDLLSKWS